MSKWNGVIVVTNLLEKVLSCDGFQDILLGRLLDLTTEHELVQHEVGLLKVENDVQLTHL